MKSKKLFALYFILLLIVVVVMINLKKTEPQSIITRDFPQIQEEGILRIITEYNQSGYYINGDTIEGFQYELSQAIADVSGLEIQILLEMNLAESFRILNENGCDIIARNIPVTIENKENYLFTEPLILNKQILVQKTAEENNGVEPIRNQLELKGKTIYIPKDSPARLRLNNLSDEIGDTIYIVENELYSSEQLLILVANGEIDFAVCDLQTSQRYKNAFPQLDMDTDISFTQLQAWAVRKDSPALLDSLNSWLDQIREKGVLDNIHKRYHIN